MQHKVKQLLGEKGGQTLRAEIYSDVDGYSIKYFINGNLQRTETLDNTTIEMVEDKASNWINQIEILNG